MRRAAQPAKGARQPAPPPEHAETRPPKSPGGGPKQQQKPRPSSKPQLALDDDAPPKEIRLFVGGLSGAVTDSDIKGRFAPFGTVNSIELVQGKALGAAARHA